MELNQDVQYIKGVGPTKVKLLNNLGIYTLEDLITYYPRDYEDRGKPRKIEDLQDGEEALIKAIPASRFHVINVKRNMKICKLLVRDETGTMEIVWYNQQYLKDKFIGGKWYSFYGKVSKKTGTVTMNSPVFDSENESKNTGKIIPIYPLTYKLSQNVLRQIIENGLKMVNGQIEEIIPDNILREYKLIGVNEATNKIHFPKDFEEFKQARQRLAFEELLTMQLLLNNLKNKTIESHNGIQFDENVKMSDIINSLPFRLTKAQLRVLEEIDKDMESNKIMNRLLQGDVGSGKTIVAIISAYKAVKSGYQMAIMAPTSILATQHLQSFTQILEPFGIKCELLISNMTKKKKEEVIEKLEKGEIDVLVGTHSILEENIVFKNLGLVVTDEQHRFGVNQRSVISAKGKNVDTLVMTATPIPRTLGLILYGDLDISSIDELPPDRKKIETYAVTKGMEERINNFIKKQINEGRQCYIVCPLVEENEEINAKSVMEMVEIYKNQVFTEFRVEYMYGKMKQKEKDQIMQEFKDGKIDILISTTVIEVGVNVPNASIMVIQNAERFGLATLHQLRGRVGRGEYQSYCILKYQGHSNTILQRMKVMQDTNDGFVISEKDLELRGTGDFFGTKQHGLPEFKVANLFEDIDTLKQVQLVANKISNEDPNLEKKENQKLKEMINKRFIGRIEI
ncbi:MAG: ATP-dependent DNA helicase RecG [Clostridia bacterium]|nr:ATP-dependent DNA helicase RecG [Clostridia bacterium]